jgi:hypothetical protein
MSKVELATSRRINAVWTVAFKRVEGGVEILAYGRNCEMGYERESELPEGELIEDDQRVAIELFLSKSDSWRKKGVSIKDQKLKIVNPRHVFSYGEKFPYDQL